MSDASPPIPRPKRPGNYEIVARSAKILQRWNEACHQYAGEMQRVHDRLEAQPAYDDGDRQHPLEGRAGRGHFEGNPYTRWQIDVTSGGRIWYFVDSTPTGSGQRRRDGRVIIDEVHFGHPKSTESKPGGKRRPGRR